MQDRDTPGLRHIGVDVNDLYLRDHSDSRPKHGQYVQSDTQPFIMSHDEN